MENKLKKGKKTNIKLQTNLNYNKNKFLEYENTFLAVRNS